MSLLLVEDHRVFADVLAERIRAQPGVRRVEIAGTLSEARASLRRSQPDLVLLDLQLGGELGTDLLDDLAQLADRPHVVMLSGMENTSQVVDAFVAGAEGWVSKTADFDSLMFAANEVVRGHMYLAPASLRPVLEHLLGQRETRASGNSFVEGLSTRQLEVLRCLVSGMSRAECAQRLHLSVNTVRTHVQALLKRADVHTTLALATVAREAGVRGIEDEA